MRIRLLSDVVMASFHILDDSVESHACEQSPEIPSPEIGKCLTDKKDN